MVFTDREKFIQALTVFMISDDAKEMTVEKRQGILDYIRKKYAPSITDLDWGSIADEIESNKEWIFGSIKEYKQPPEEIIAESMKEPEPEIATPEPEPIPEEKPKKKLLSFGRFKKDEPKKKLTVKSLFKK